MTLAQDKGWKSFLILCKNAVPAAKIDGVEYLYQKLLSLKLVSNVLTAAKTVGNQTSMKQLSCGSKLKKMIPTKIFTQTSQSGTDGFLETLVRNTSS